MKTFLIALLLASAASAARAQDMNDIPKMDSEDDHPCDAEFEEVDEICTDETGYDMEKCFESCMDERQVFFAQGQDPPCPELAAALCSCGDHCAHHEECKAAMKEAIKCNLERMLDCPGHECGMGHVDDVEGEEL
mmetsp:Transcript_38160/g.80019  ORF Transcript_38160/g.80019 Transcript_38160/m.80019 type:complete len:135 (+) Transcript_38160:66-470(+)